MSQTHKESQHPFTQYLLQIWSNLVIRLPINEAFLDLSSTDKCLHCRAEVAWYLPNLLVLEYGQMGVFQPARHYNYTLNTCSVQIQKCSCIPFGSCRCRLLPGEISRIHARLVFLHQEMIAYRTLRSIQVLVFGISAADSLIVQCCLIKWSKDEYVQIAMLLDYMLETICRFFWT